jgi:hypothetical protein
MIVDGTTTNCNTLLMILAVIVNHCKWYWGLLLIIVNGIGTHCNTFLIIVNGTSIHCNTVSLAPTDLRHCTNTTATHITRHHCSKNLTE